jgi:16S rRNA A1518/A1519 N6-dimethyltransferase RsmA/KsgA/DIM1 with predicted DNA glycosylase/AP lyase activity
VPGRSRSGRSQLGWSHGRGLGQHFLESTALASRLAADAGIAPSDHVVEFGAGTGTLTAALLDRGARVSAIEVDAVIAAGLVRRFAHTNAVAVFACDLSEFPLPATPYRVFANPPFNRTAAILHRLLDDPAGGLVRADLVVQWQVARALARVGHDDAVDLVGASWAPWWHFRRARRLPAQVFRPAPSVDAAVLTVTRRAPSALALDVAPAFRQFVRERFDGSGPHTADDWVQRFRRHASPADSVSAARGRRTR